MAKTPSALIAMAESQLGYDRYKDPQQGTKYGRWYAELTHSPWFGTNGVPYCAMFVSWCLAQLQISCTGCPTASCTSGLLAAARRAGKLKRIQDGKGGDVVLFDWSRRGYTSPEADHTGILVANRNGSIETIEGNVDNGKVLRRTRSYIDVVGCFTPDFEEDEVTDADIQKIAKAVMAAQIDYKNGIDDKPHKASLASRVGYIDYITHTIIRKLDEIIALLAPKKA